jgi:hypothetical protein
VLVECDERTERGGIEPIRDQRIARAVPRNVRCGTSAAPALGRDLLRGAPERERFRLGKQIREQLYVLIPARVLT